jgi:ech hydrogenase subunit D
MDKAAFLARVEEFHAGGYRLALINATTVMPGVAPTSHGAAHAPAATPAAAGAPEPAAEDAFEVTWAFAKDAEFETIRERVLPGDTIPSISASFGAAFLYENELRELFGIDVTGINVDLRGAMYKTNTRMPFSHQAVRARLEATAAAAGATAVSGPVADGKKP